MMLYVVGFGCGSAEGMTLQARDCIERCETVVGYTTYVDLLRGIFPGKDFRTTGMRQERERVELALSLAKSRDTALVCSGDAQLYGMAGLALQMSADDPETQIEVIAGVSAAFSGGAVLGSPLTHDFAVISLSDLLTPWEKIEKRLDLAAQADLTIVLYNPASRTRRDHLRRACDILLRSKSPSSPCGYVRNIGRGGQESGILTLAALRDFEADMFTTIFIGNSETQVIGGRLVTPRGYRNG